MQLLAAYHAKKQHFEKIFKRRTMQSAIRLFVFDFLSDSRIFARTIRQGDNT
jgi:hypothetical protein